MPKKILMSFALLLAANDLVAGEMSGGTPVRSNSGVSTSGINTSGFTCALQKAQSYLKGQGASKGLKSQYIVLIDYSAPQDSQRMMIVDANSGQIVSRHNVSGAYGGINSTPGENGIELGFMKYSEIYSGKHGASCRIDGLDADNQDMRSRATVLHSASYVQENGHTGRSNGCQAVSEESIAEILQKVSNGTLAYAYKGIEACYR